MQRKRITSNTTAFVNNFLLIYTFFGVSDNKLRFITSHFPIFNTQYSHIVNTEQKEIDQ